MTFKRSFNAISPPWTGKNHYMGIQLNSFYLIHYDYDGVARYNFEVDNADSKRCGHYEPIHFYHLEA